MFLTPFFRNLLTGNAGRPLFFITQPKGEVRWTSPFGFSFFFFFNCFFNIIVL